MKPFSIIVACDQKNGIGFKGKLPWHLPADLKYFKEVTMRVEQSGSSNENALIMGRVTWDSIPEKFQPLPQRVNLVLSRNPQFLKPKGVLGAISLPEALEKIKNNPQVEKIFVIGGQQVLKEAIVHPLCEKIYLTRILQTFECDAFLPSIPPLFKEDKRTQTLEENGLSFYFCEYTKRTP